MSDYIDRQAVIDALAKHEKSKGHNYTLFVDIVSECAEIIRDLPSAEVEPVKRGKWEITEAYPHNVYCSVCHKRYAQTHWAVWEDGSLLKAYCPNCGAKMEDKTRNNKRGTFSK